MFIYLFIIFLITTYFHAFYSGLGSSCRFSLDCTGAQPNFEKLSGNVIFTFFFFKRHAIFSWEAPSPLHPLTSWSVSLPFSRYYIRAVTLLIFWKRQFYDYLSLNILNSFIFVSSNASPGSSKFGRRSCTFGLPPFCYGVFHRITSLDVFRCYRMWHRLKLASRFLCHLSLILRQLTQSLMLRNILVVNARGNVFLTSTLWYESFL